MWRRVFSVVLLILCLVPVMRAGAIVVPGVQTASEGNADNGFPFNISDPANGSLPSMRYQQVFASSEFTGPILITAINFRPDAVFGPGFGAPGPFSTTLPSVRIDLSTTSVAPDGLSLTFASNVGADNLIVFPTGPLSLSTSFTGPPGGPKAFDIHIAFSSPFLYNPANGNLLLDVRNFGGGITTQFDAQLTSGDSVSRVDTSDVNAASGGADSAGLVTQFEFADVPEPSTGLLAGTAARRPDAVEEN